MLNIKKIIQLAGELKEAEEKEKRYLSNQNKPMPNLKCEHSKIPEMCQFVINLCLNMIYKISINNS